MRIMAVASLGWGGSMIPRCQAIRETSQLKLVNAVADLSEELNIKHNAHDGHVVQQRVWYVLCVRQRSATGEPISHVLEHEAHEINTQFGIFNIEDNPVVDCCRHWIRRTTARFVERNVLCVCTKMYYQCEE